MSNITLSIINLRTNKENALATHQVYINKNPDFQREYEAWDDKLKTRFIETILIGRAMNPIWTIYNPEEKSEEILDGMHRITTALDFLNNKFHLLSKYFTDQSRGEKYDKKTFNDLSDDDQNRIRNYNFIFNQLDSTYRTDVNKRRDQYEILNRSSKTLNDYEFNKVLYGPFFDIISIYKNDLNGLFFNKNDKERFFETNNSYIFDRGGNDEIYYYIKKYVYYYIDVRWPLEMSNMSHELIKNTSTNKYAENKNDCKFLVPINENFYVSTVEGTRYYRDL
jgi:hypothetical protein